MFSSVEQHPRCRHVTKNLTAHGTSSPCPAHVALTSRCRDEDERECFPDGFQILFGISISKFTEVLLSGDGRKREGTGGNGRGREETGGDGRKREGTGGDGRKREGTGGNGRGREETGGDGRKREGTGGNGRGREETGGDGRKREGTGGNGRGREETGGDGRKREGTSMMVGVPGRGDNGWRRDVLRDGSREDGEWHL